MNRRKSQCAGLLLWGLAWLFPTGSGLAAGPDTPFFVDRWSTRDGLPDSEVISVIQTRDGYLWLGTLNGLVRFDGLHFTIFDQHNTPGLNSDRIVRLFEDSHTNLWIGTDTAGVALVQDGKVRNFDLGRSGHEGRLMSACEDPAGAVWLYTADAHLGRYQDGKLESLNLNINFPPICRMLVSEKSGRMWLGEYGAGESWGQLFSFQPANFHPPALPIDQTLQVGRLDYIVASQRGGTWRLINGRVQKWTTQLEKDWGPYPWGNATVTSACEDERGNLVVGTLGAGAFWYAANGTFQQISTNQGLSSAFVLSTCMDRQGNLWLGTDGYGLNRVKRKLFESPPSLHPWTAQSLAEDAAGGLWTTFGAFGASYWKTNSTQDFPVGRYHNAWTVLVDHQQQVWIGTWEEGLFQLQTNGFQPAPRAGNLGRRIFSLFEDRRGQLWAGTQNGLAKWDGRDWTIYTTQEGLSENIVRAIAEDAQGQLWIGTESHGLDLFSDGKFTSYPATESGLPGNDISCLCLDSEGVLWVGTSGHGLARYCQGNWTRYSTDEGLASNSIDYIIEDEEGYLWIGSNTGLMRIPKKSLNDFAPGKGRRIPCRTYVETDGLATRECSAGSQPAACRTRDGRLWFPTTKGPVSVDPADIQTNQQPPAVMIESVLVDGQEQKTNRFSSAWQASVTVPPGSRYQEIQLEIHFTGLNFSAPGDVKFKYRLEGHESAWTEPGDTRVAYYPNLPPGKYRFQVIAGNEDGVWNETGARLEVTVDPQFWQTPGFRIVVALALVGMVVAVVRYLSTQKLRRQLQLLEQQEALEKERSRIARDLHDQLGANLTQVALLGEMAETDKDSPAEVESHARQIAATARETTRSLDEIVWAANPSNDTLEGLANYACKYAQEYIALAGLRYRAEVPSQLPAIPIPPDVRHNAFLAFKEAVNNVVKHAHASEVWIRLRLGAGHFTLSVEDNGRGLGADTGAAPARNGLRNMRKRMADIHGEFSIGPGTEGGTRVQLTIPLGKTP